VWLTLTEGAEFSNITYTVENLASWDGCGQDVVPAEDINPDV